MLGNTTKLIVIFILTSQLLLAREAHEYTDAELKSAGWTEQQISNLRNIVADATDTDQDGIVHIDHYCGYFDGNNPGSIHSFSPSNHVEAAINKVMSITGLPKNFEVIAGGVPNAAAVIYKNKRIIAYNQSFLHDIESEIGSQWPAFSIMAHEIGHHLAGHTISSKQGRAARHKVELEADRYSGFAMQRLGSTLTEAQLVMQLVASETGNESHPAKRDRLAAIANGWLEECERNSRCSGASSNTSQTINTTSATVPVSADKAIEVNDWRFELGKFCAYDYTLTKYADECEIAKKAVLLKAREIFQTGSSCVKYKEYAKHLIEANDERSRERITKRLDKYLDTCKTHIQRYAYSAEISALTQLANSNLELYREGSQWLAFGFIPEHESDPRVVRHFTLTE